MRVIGIDPGGLMGGDDAGRLQSFADQTGATFPIGLEQTFTYGTFASSTAAISPFPVDVIVDANGNVAYQANEYDPSAMQAVIDKLLLP